MYVQNGKMYQTPRIYLTKDHTEHTVNQESKLTRNEKIGGFKLYANNVFTVGLSTSVKKNLGMRYQDQQLEYESNTINPEIKVKSYGTLQIFKSSQQITKIKLHSTEVSQKDKIR